MTQSSEMESLQEFDEILTAIADSCEINHPWAYVKELVKWKIDQNVRTDQKAVEESNKGEMVGDYLARIWQALDAFEEYVSDTCLSFGPVRTTDEAYSHSRPPFTLQRLCELSIRPTEHHKTVWKYLRALEKVLLVTSFDDADHIHGMMDLAPSETSIVATSGEPVIQAGTAGLDTPDTPVPHRIGGNGVEGMMDGVATVRPAFGVESGSEGVVQEVNGKEHDGVAPMETD
ncbi:protein phosphatase 4, regulatory subunit 2 [Borealophlyctis nickersoniae]|nr:protein phosphatase 4, regulatory subunit 2 [Borealophlyctis nickersoniae]